jgi:GWxTD domain-containing protein
MLSKLGFCFILLFSAIHANAIDAVVAHTVFYLHDSAHNNSLWPAVETYWEINPHTIHYSTTPEKTIIGRIKAHIIFTSDSGFVKDEQFILQTVPSTNVKDLGSHRIIDLRRYFLTPGTFHMKFILTDVADSINQYTYTDTFTIPAPVSTAFYSGLQLLDTTVLSAAKTIYEKNGRQQIPVCTNFLDEPKHTLHYYAELYDANLVSKNDYPLVQKVYIARKPDESPIDNFIRKDTIKGGEFSTLSGDFDIRYLGSGNYYLVATLENNYHAPVATNCLFFQRLNLHPMVDTVKKAAIATAVDTGMESINVLNLNKTFVAKYDLGQVKAILKMLIPFSDNMAVNTINGFLKNPQELYMRYYIYNYFLNINKKDPERAWKEFSEKIIDVNKRFNGRITPGYETDRGIIYLKYGEPSEIITVENEPGALPYEIWQYNTLTQLNKKDIPDAIFLFYKANETEEFRLLHSTVSGEVQNTAWRRYLYLNSGSSSLDNSRAAQYLENK